MYLDVCASHSFDYFDLMIKIIEWDNSLSKTT